MTDVGDAYKKGYRAGKSEADSTGYEEGSMLFFEGFYDDQICRLIEDGEFDDSVKDRMKTLPAQQANPHTILAQEELQMMHRAWHKDSPWGWEFCAKCSDMFRSVL